MRERLVASPGEFIPYRTKLVKFGVFLRAVVYVDSQLGEVEIDNAILAKKEQVGRKKRDFDNKGEQFYSIYKSRQTHFNIDSI